MIQVVYFIKCHIKNHSVGLSTVLQLPLQSVRGSFPVGVTLHTFFGVSSHAGS